MRQPPISPVAETLAADNSAPETLALMEIAPNGRIVSLPTNLATLCPDIKPGDSWTGHVWKPMAKRALVHLSRTNSYDGPIWLQPRKAGQPRRLWVQVRKTVAGGLVALIWPGFALRESGLAALRRQTRDRLHALQAMAQSFAEELSTPTLILRGAALSLTSSQPIDTQALGELIRSASERAAIACQDMSLLIGPKAMSASHDGVRPEKQITLDLRTALSDAAFPFRGEAAAMGLRLKTSRAASPLLARLDGACFKAVTARLIGCALRHAQGSSTLILRADLAARRETGVGRAHVWIWIEPSPTRGETDQNGARPTNGPAHALAARLEADLNLKAARLLAERLDGHVQLTRNGEGVLALHMDVAAEPVLDAAPPSATARRPIALIADDHVKQRRMASLQFEALGYDAIEVSDGAQAVKVFAAQRVDLVVLDWRMPGLDGVQAAQAIRKSGAWGRNVPILIATAESGFGAAMLAERAGADRVLFKPLQAIDYVMAMPQARLARSGTADTGGVPVTASKAASAA